MLPARSESLRLFAHLPPPVGYTLLPAVLLMLDYRFLPGSVDETSPEYFSCIVRNFVR